MARTRGKIGRYYPYQSRRAADIAKSEAIRQVVSAKVHGLLIEQPCDVCKTVDGVEAHHDDYRRPLDVNWLCRKHHRDRHRQLRHADDRIWAGTDIVTVEINAKRTLASNPEISKTLILSVTQALSDEINRQGLTQHYVASRLKVSRQYMSTIMQSGVRTLRVLSTLADALGCDVRIVLDKRNSDKLA